MITIFSTPKDFTGIYKTIQINALRSWRALSPDIQIIILGDSKNSRQILKEIKATYIQNVKCSSSGIPLLSDIFLKAEKIAQFNIMVFVNADIILPIGFIDSIIVSSKRFNQFLMVGHRWDIDIGTEIDFSTEKASLLFWDSAKKNSIKHPCTGIDYFVYRKYQWGILPKFVVGKPGYDNWLIWKARRNLIPVIDASENVFVLHQNHQSSYKNSIGKIKIKNQDVIINKKLHKDKLLNLLDANYHIIKGEVVKKQYIEFIIRNLHRLPLIFPEFSIPIKIYRRLYKRLFFV